VRSVDIESAVALPQFAARKGEVVAVRKLVLVCSHAIANFLNWGLLRLEMAGAGAEGVTWLPADRAVKRENGDKTCVLGTIRICICGLFSVICGDF
jgi:hypothetical protein